MSEPNNIDDFSSSCKYHHRVTFETDLQNKQENVIERTCMCKRVVPGSKTVKECVVGPPILIHAVYVEAQGILVPPQ